MAINKYIYGITIINSKGEAKRINVIASNPDLAKRGVERIMHIPIDKQTMRSVTRIPDSFYNFDNIDLYVPDDFK